ncbi:MAG: hypothetical protein GX963_03615 [Bacteroidales bacterium]|nr:hypothetical protein [Bacteroidales bacterium]
MKILKNISKSMVVLISVALLVTSCYTDNSDPMKEHISKVSERIQSLDKTIASPGDVITVKGKELDKVFKIMLGTNLTIIEFNTKSSTELEFVIPNSAPLGDVIIINFFFEGNGLAQRYIELMSPPVVAGFSPIAALGGESFRIMGIELYKAVEVYIGDEKVEFSLIDDKNIAVESLPNITDGAKIKIIDELGLELISENGIKRGTEILVTDFDSQDGYFGEMSPNGNLNRGNANELKGEQPYNNYYSFGITDEGTSWGGNVDFFLDKDNKIDAKYDDNTKVWLYIDLKLSDLLNEGTKTRIMVEGQTAVYGDDYDITTEWVTYKLLLSEAYTGYGNGSEQGAAPIMAEIKGVKVQPDVTEEHDNFGKVLYVDNIKFIVEE